MVASAIRRRTSCPSSVTLVLLRRNKRGKEMVGATLSGRRKYGIPEGNTVCVAIS